MSDLIDRNYLFDLLKEEGRYGYLDAEDVKNAPSAQEWIPVTERLPEYNVNVLCFCKDFWDGHCEVLQREHLNWFRGVEDTDRWLDPQSLGDEYVRDYTIDYVTAWMPLPEPYEEAEE